MPSSLANESQRLRFFHVPKAGSSFAEYIWAWSCPLLPRELRTVTLRQDTQNTKLQTLRIGRREGKCPRNQGLIDRAYHHEPLVHDWDVRAAAGLFRAPAARIVSAFNYNLHAASMDAGNWSAMKAAVSASTSRSAQLRSFAAWPGIAHITTKMLLGRAPSEMIPSSVLDMEAALDRLHHMAFVGLTECFNESAVLFARRFPSELYPRHPPHVRQAKNSTAASDEKLLCSTGFEETPDALIYQAAALRFMEELRRERVPVTSGECRDLLDAWRPPGSNIPSNEVSACRGTHSHKESGSEIV